MTEPNPILAVIKSIQDAVALVDVSEMENVREVVVRGMGEELEPPAVVVGPPSLEREGFGSRLTASNVVVYVVVDKTDDTRAMEQLYQLVPAVMEAIEDHVENASCGSARPGTYPVGARDLPAYGIPVEIDL